MTAAPDFERMTDREVLVQVATVQDAMQQDIREIKEHAAEVNCTVAGLVLIAARQEGAIFVLRAVVAVTAVGVAVASVIIGSGGI